MNERYIKWMLINVTKYRYHFYSNKLECTIANAQILEHSTHVQLIRFNEILDTQILNRREVVDVLKEPLNCVYQPS